MVARGRRFCSGAAIAWALFLAATSGAAQPSGTPPSAAQETEADASYKQHMSNGVKLFQDRNLTAAIAEFQAAYRAKPKASPLINIALCHKGLFHYPKAIGALETALAKHGDAMDPDDKRAAEEAIAEMSALLAHVTVTVSPKHATLSIDGEDQPRGITEKPVPLGPGPHTFRARAEGHASVERSISVASGDKSQAVSLALVPDKGFVRIRANDAKTSIAVDQRPLAQGFWEGFLLPGTHLVQIYKPGGASTGVQVQVAAGVGQEIAIGKGGAAVVTPFRAIAQFGETGESGADPLAPPPMPDRPKLEPAAPAREPHLRGMYALATAAVFVPGTEPSDQSVPMGPGRSVGARLGYRMITALGLELMVDYESASNSDRVEASATSPAFESDYEANSLRFGGNMRFMSPGQRARFVAALGLGVAYDVFSLRKRFGLSASEVEQSASSANFYFNSEQGVEFNVGHVLIGLVMQQTFSTTGGLDEGSLALDKNALNIGLGVRVGYGSWVGSW